MHSNISSSTVGSKKGSSSSSSGLDQNCVVLIFEQCSHTWMPKKLGSPMSHQKWSAVGLRHMTALIAYRPVRSTKRAMSSATSDVSHVDSVICLAETEVRDGICRINLDRRHNPWLQRAVFNIISWVGTVMYPQIHIDTFVCKLAWPHSRIRRREG
jgi:hypothetical protein